MIHWAVLSTAAGLLPMAEIDGDAVDAQASRRSSANKKAREIALAGFFRSDAIYAGAMARVSPKM
jgi:hypothetical protein